MLLILVLAPLFFLSQAGAELRVVKQKNMLIKAGHIIFNFYTINDK